MSAFISVLRKQICNAQHREKLLRHLQGIWEAAPESLAKLASESWQVSDWSSMRQRDLAPVTDLLASFAILTNFDELVSGERLVVKEEGRVEQDCVLLNPGGSSNKARARSVVVVVDNGLKEVEPHQLSRYQSYEEQIAEWNLPTECLSHLMAAIRAVLAAYSVPMTTTVPSPKSLLLGELQARAAALFCCK